MQNSFTKCARCGVELREHYRKFHAFLRDWDEDGAVNDDFAEQLDKLTR